MESELIDDLKHLAKTFKVLAFIVPTIILLITFFGTINKLPVSNEKIPFFEGSTLFFYTVVIIVCVIVAIMFYKEYMNYMWKACMLEHSINIDENTKNKIGDE